MGVRKQVAYFARDLTFCSEGDHLGPNFSILGLGRVAETGGSWLSFNNNLPHQQASTRQKKEKLQKELFPFHCSLKFLQNSVNPTLPPEVFTNTI